MMKSLKPYCLLMLIAIALSGCGSAPKKAAPLEYSLDIGAAESQLAESRLPVFLIAANEHRYALYDLKDAGFDQGRLGSKSMLIFEDGRLIGRLESAEALRHASCLAQSGGRQILAARLVSLSLGAGDPLEAIDAKTTMTAGERLCPEPPELKPTPARSQMPENAWTLMGDILVYSALIVLGVITLPITLPLGVGMAISEAGSVKDFQTAQSQLAVQMESTQIERLIGPPSFTFCLEPIGNDVMYYPRPGMTGLWLGIDQGHLVWLRSGQPDRWLRELTEQQRENGKSCR